ncbi:MAG: tetratricopeptide repeat protein [Proteobacteria bacterium]|nr:tetratricopeptide repeat protein [Pseudomonadota bacterium]
MNWESYEAAVRQLNFMLKEKRFAEALGQVDQLLETSPGSVALWIKWAMLIQLQNDDVDLPPLGECRESLKRAIQLEPDSSAAYIELGNFEYAVADDLRAALDCFEKATGHAESGLKAALIGLMKCQMELGRQDDALTTLERMKTIFPDDLEVAMMEDEITG